MEIVFKKIDKTFADHPEVFTTRNLPKIRQIDIHMGQPDNPEEWEVFCPAIFIAWSITPGDDGEPNILTLEFHVLQEPGAATDNKGVNVDEGLEYLRLLKAVKFILNKLKATNTSPLQFAGERPAITQFFRYHIITYICNIDTENESLHDPVYTDGTIDTLKITEGKLKQTGDKKTAPVIEVFTRDL